MVLTSMSEGFGIFSSALALVLVFSNYAYLLSLFNQSNMRVLKLFLPNLISLTGSSFA